MKKKLSFLLALVFVLTLAFNILPAASAEPLHDHSATLPAGYHWDCTLVPDKYAADASCGKTVHDHDLGCYGNTCGLSTHVHSDLTCQAYEFTCTKDGQIIDWFQQLRTSMLKCIFEGHRSSQLKGHII